MINAVNSAPSTGDNPSLEPKNEGQLPPISNEPNPTTKPDSVSPSIFEPKEATTPGTGMPPSSASINPTQAPFFQPPPTVGSTPSTEPSTLSGQPTPVLSDSPSFSPPPPETPGTPPPSTGEEMPDFPPAPPSGSKPPGKKGRFSAKMVIGGVLLILLVVGSGAGLYLAQQNQELRQQASETTTSGAPNCGSCVGSCGTTGCSTTCDSNTNPQDDCGIWPAAFMCDAQAAWNTGCNENNCIKNSSGGCVTPITDYSNPGSWCKKFQFDSNAPNNAASVVYVGNGGQVCMEGTGCDKNALDMNCAAETPAGNYTLACSPPKPNQTVGDLRYEVKVDGTAPKNFGQAVFFLSLSKNSYPNHQQGFAELTQWLGKPTWSDNCTSVDWCGYWIHQINDPDPNSNNTVSWIWDKNKSLSFSGGQQNININMIANKVKELKDQGKLPANYTMKLAGEFRLPPDFQTKHPLGEKTIDISPYACTSEPQLISREYNVTTQFVCPDGSSPTAIAKRMYWAIWPPGDVTWVPRPLGYLPGATGNSITANINFASLDTANNSSIYVAMARADLGTAWSAWSGKAYKAINPPSGFSAGTYFNPLTQMFKFPVNTTPSGSYTLKFEAPPELCAAPPPSPSPTPIQCNGECIQGASPGQQGACASGLSCVNVGEGSQLLFRCRNASYPNQTNCQPPPSPSPSPRPMCLTISMNNDAPKINDQVVFTCAQIPGATSYRFRVKEPDGNTITLAAEGNKSASYTITKSGKFIAECALSDSQGELPWPSEGDMKP